MNTRFPILSILSIILKVVGAMIVVAGFVGLIIQDSNTVYKLVGILLLVLGIIVCVIGEIIGVAFAIEDNTRKTANLLEEFIQSKNTAELPSKTNPPKYIA